MKICIKKIIYHHALKWSMNNPEGIPLLIAMNIFYSIKPLDYIVASTAVTSSSKTDRRG